MEFLKRVYSEEWFTVNERVCRYVCIRITEAAMCKEICCLLYSPCSLLPFLSLHFPNLCLKYYRQIEPQLPSSGFPPFSIPATYANISQLSSTHTLPATKGPTPCTAIKVRLRMCVCVSHSVLSMTWHYLPSCLFSSCS